MEDWIRELKRLILADLEPLGKSIANPERFQSEPLISPAMIQPWLTRIHQLEVQVGTRLAAEGSPWMLTAWRFYQLLGILALGTQGQTQQQLLTLLDIEAEALPELAKGLYHLERMVNQRELEPVSPMRPALWYHQELTWEADFLDLMHTFFSVRTQAMDFDDVGALLQANARLHTWMAPAAPEDIARFPGWLMLVMQHDLRLVWKHPFSPANTISYQFKARPGLQTPCQMMQQLLLLPVWQDEKVLGMDFALLPEGLRLRIVMPLQESQMILEDTKLWQQKWPMQKGRIGLPRMQWRQTRDLRPVLEELGVETLFDPLQANLSTMISQQVSLDAWPDHQAVLLHEGGIGGAAPMDKGGHQSLGTATLELWLDRPFHFAVQDTTNGQTLFRGYADASCLTLP